MESKCYNLVMYQEMDVIKFLDCCLNSKGKNISQIKYAYILHDKDEKKPHYHIYISFPEPVKSINIEKYLNLVGIDTSALSHSKTNETFLAYLTHSTRESIGVKSSYNWLDIITNIDDFEERYKRAIERANTMTRQEKKIAQFSINISSINDTINENIEIINYSSLCQFLISNNMMEELQFTLSRAYAINMMFKDIFTANSIKYSSSILKGENRAKLADIQAEFDKANENRKKLEEMEEKVQELC